MRRIGSFLPCLAGIAALALPLAAIAGTDTDQLNVTATVQTSCALNGGTLNFGEYNSGQQTDLDVEGTIAFAHCSGNLSFELDGGGTGNVNSRQMSSGSNRLDYQIYRNPTRSAVWGSGTNAQGMVLLTTQSGTVPVYGRIPGGQTVPPGTYSDVVNITMTF